MHCSLYLATNCWHLLYRTIKDLCNRHILFLCVEHWSVRPGLSLTFRVLPSFTFYEQCWYPCVFSYSSLIVTTNNSWTNVLPEGPGTIISFTHAYFLMPPSMTGIWTYFVAFLPSWCIFHWCSWLACFDYLWDWIYFHIFIIWLLILNIFFNWLLVFLFSLDYFVCILAQFLGGSDVKESACNAGDLALIPRSERSPGEREWLPTPVFLPGKSCGQRSLPGYSPWGCEESDTTKRLTRSFIKLGYVDLLVSFLYCRFNLLTYAAFSFSSLFTVLVLLYIYIKFLNSLSSICMISSFRPFLGSKHVSFFRYLNMCLLLTNMRKCIP